MLQFRMLLSFVQVAESWVGVLNKHLPMLMLTLVVLIPIVSPREQRFKGVGVGIIAAFVLILGVDLLRYLINLGYENVPIVVDSIGA